jgi:hypothetical protein
LAYFVIVSLNFFSTLVLTTSGFNDTWWGMQPMPTELANSDCNHVSIRRILTLVEQMFHRLLEIGLLPLDSRSYYSRGMP